MRGSLLSLGLLALVGCGPSVVIQPGGPGGPGGPGTGLDGGPGNGTGALDGGNGTGSDLDGGTIGNLTQDMTPGTGTGTALDGGTGTGTALDGGTGTGTGTGTGQLPTKLLVAGAYDVTTQFNFLDTLPPDVETALQLTLEFADSPGNFLLDMAGRLPVIKYIVDVIDLFSGIKDTITHGIDEYINRWSGGMVTVMHDMSVDLTMGLRGLKAHNHLVVGAPDATGNLSVQDTLVDLTFSYKGTDYPYPQGAKATTSGTLSGLRLQIAAHPYDKGVRFGGMLLDIIDNVALPALTGVNNLGDLLNQLVNCGGVADWVWGYIGNWCLTDDQATCIYKYITANDLTKLCINALDGAGNLIEHEISKLDAPGMMSMSDASCLILENKGHTGHADTLMSGTWTLSLPIGLGVVPLPGTFTGKIVP